MRSSELPYIDEDSTVVDATPEVVWRALTERLGGAFSGAGAIAYARAVGCTDVRAGGPRPLAAGSTITGFHVEEAAPPSLLALAGRHRFSTYELVFRIDAVDAGRSRLRAETRAEFPSVLGRLYRWLVIGSGGHVVVVRRLLRGIGTAAERASRRAAAA